MARVWTGDNRRVLPIFAVILFVCCNAAIGTANGESICALSVQESAVNLHQMLIFNMCVPSPELRDDGKEKLLKRDIEDAPQQKLDPATFNPVLNPRVSSTLLEPPGVRNIDGIEMVLNRNKSPRDIDGEC